jgi:hypothetical protein
MGFFVVVVFVVLFCFGVFWGFFCFVLFFVLLWFCFVFNSYNIRVIRI